MIIFVPKSLLSRQKITPHFVLLFLILKSKWDL